MGTLVYYNTQLTLAVGAQDVVADLAFDVVSGEVYVIRELDLILQAYPDTANTHHDVWLSVLKGGRATWDPWTDGFAVDIIGQLVNNSTARGYGSFPLETPEQGYIADDPYFANLVRLGLSTPVNVAGGNVTLSARMTAERVKQTAAITDLMYRRANT